MFIVSIYLLMDYEKVSVSELSDAPSPTTRKLEIDESAGATQFGCNLYVAEPGEMISLGYHKHPDHEELFYVMTGELEFETEDGTFTVREDEAFFVPMDHPQQGHAVGDQPTKFIGIGAPKSKDNPVFIEMCSYCGEIGDRRIKMSESREVYSLYCSNCGAQTDQFS